MKSLNKLISYNAVSNDGYNALIKDFVFDTKDWTAKFLKIDFGGLLSSEFEFVPTELILEVDAAKNEIKLQSTHNIRNDYLGRELQTNKRTSVNEDLYTSFHQFKGYHVVGTESRIGSIHDLIVDNNWTIHYALIDSGNWLPWSKTIPFETGLFRDISHPAREIYAPVSSSIIKDTPQLSLEELEETNTEKMLHDLHFNH